MSLDDEIRRQRDLLEELRRQREMRQSIEHQQSIFGRDLTREAVRTMFEAAQQQREPSGLVSPHSAFRPFKSTNN